MTDTSTEQGVLPLRIGRCTLPNGWLREERQRQGLTQWALGMRMGVRPDNVSRWEKDGYALTAAQVHLLADALGLRIELSSDELAAA